MESPEGRWQKLQRQDVSCRIRDLSGFSGNKTQQSDIFLPFQEHAILRQPSGLIFIFDKNGNKTQMKLRYRHVARNIRQNDVSVSEASESFHSA